MSSLRSSQTSAIMNSDNDSTVYIYNKYHIHQNNWFFSFAYII